MWALIQYDWYLYKKRRLGHRHARRKDHVKTKVKVAQSCLTATPWIAACQAVLSMEFSRQEYWSG